MGSSVITLLWVSLILVLLFIGYKYLLRRLNREVIVTDSSIELFDLEELPAKGELPFYFSAKTPTLFRLFIMDEAYEEVKEIANQECKEGGNIVRFDSTVLENGNYFYCLKTENQKIVKKMRIAN